MVNMSQRMLINQSMNEFQIEFIRMPVCIKFKL